MSRFSASPRRHESPLQRRKRAALSAPAGNQSCVEVQWRFLTPHSSVRSVGKLSSAEGGSPTAPRGASVDYYYYGARPATDSLAAIAPHQDQRQKIEPSRVLDGLTGETQRQAALDRIMAEMHDLMVHPPASSASSAEGRASPVHERRKCSSVLLENIKFPDGPSGGVSLLPQRKRSTLGIIADSRGRVTDDDEDEEETEEERGGESGDVQNEDGGNMEASSATAFAPSQRRKWKCHDADADHAPQFVWQKSATARFAAGLPHRLDQNAAASFKRDGSPRPPDAATSPSATARAPYGAWYVPQHHWWPLRQLEQQAANDVNGRETPRQPPPSHGHCHHGASPAQRQHKPPLAPTSPAAAASSSSVSPRGRNGRRPSVCSLAAPSFPPSSPSTPTSPSPPSSSLAGAAGVELQLASSYIGREYRSYIVATGSPLPHYLK